MRKTPIATSLEGVLAVCERQYRNCALMFFDCADNGDCSSEYIWQLQWTQNNWKELADDVRAIIENETKKHLPSD